MDDEERAPLLAPDPRESRVEHERLVGNASIQNRNYIRKLPNLSSSYEDEDEHDEEQADNGVVLDESGVHDVHAQTTNMQCLMHLLKGMIGTGMLAMPIAFKNGGLWVSFVCLFFVGYICVHCMHILVNCAEILCKRTGVRSMDYGTVMEKCFETGPEKLRSLAPAGRRFVNVFLLITQFGFCCIYIVFVAQNIKQFIDHFHPDSLHERWYMTFVTVLLIPYVLVKNLRALSPFSSFANVLNFVGIVIIFINLFQHIPDVSSRPAAGELNTFPLFFGQIIYSFEGIGLVLPLQNKMRDKAAFGGWNGVLNLGCAISVCLFQAMGFYGYLKYGDSTMGSITLNLPGNKMLYLSVKVVFAVAIFITYALQFYVPIVIIWHRIERKFSSDRVHVYGEYVFRIVMVLVTFGIALLVPHLDLLIGLIGAFASSTLALLLPPVIEFMTHSVEERGITRWMIVRNITILVIGVAGFITGTYTSVQSIVQTFIHEPNSTMHHLVPSGNQSIHLDHL